MIPFSPIFIDSNFLSLFKIFNNYYKLDNNEIITYSVRTSIYTFLKIKKYKKNKKVLITSINIPSIINIIKHYNLEFIGVDLNPYTLDFCKKDFLEKVKKNDICCCIYSHLFGKINDINWIIDTCKKYNIDFIEDCAECFRPDYNGNPKSDIISFSFGSIKNCTCFGGSKTIIKNNEIFKKFKKEINNYKKQSNIFYILKIIKYFYISFILNNKYINLFIRKISNILNININNIFIKLIRNINNYDLINNITYKPCLLLEKYLLYRINNYTLPNINNQNYIENNLNKTFILPGIYCNKYKNYWLYPIYFKHNLFKYLDCNYINYVKKISQLKCIDDNCKKSKDLMNNLYFFPVNSLTSLQNIKYIVYKLNSINLYSNLSGFQDNYFYNC